MCQALNLQVEDIDLSMGMSGDFEQAVSHLYIAFMLHIIQIACCQYYTNMAPACQSFLVVVYGMDVAECSVSHCHVIDNKGQVLAYICPVLMHDGV